MDTKFEMGWDWINIWIPNEHWKKIKTEKIQEINIWQSEIFGKSDPKTRVVTIYNPRKKFNVRSEKK